MSSDLAARQLAGVLGARFGAARRLRAEWTSRASELGEGLQEWYAEFRLDIESARFGYPRGIPRRATPDLEDRAIGMAEKAGWLRGLTDPSRAPALCLTHDIDYLQPTSAMRFKRAFAGGRTVRKEGGTEYLSSLRRLLEIDRAAAGRRGGSTVFVAMPAPASSLWRRTAQRLLDPAYRPGDGLFERLLDVVREAECGVGLHGSFFSLPDGLIPHEKRALEAALGVAVEGGRQHWLNLYGYDGLEALHEAGLRWDSTLGWNGGVGFRGGIPRPFPVALSNGRELMELPLALMDGPLFDDLGLESEGVVEAAGRLLDEVAARGGCVALDWHERSADPQYGWDTAYAEILRHARARGFRFLSVSEAMREYGAEEDHE
jgi:hypothetical protein